MEGDVIALQDVFTFEQKEIASDGKVIGQLESTGLRPFDPRQVRALRRAAAHEPVAPTQGMVTPFARKGAR